MRKIFEKTKAIKVQQDERCEILLNKMIDKGVGITIFESLFPSLADLAERYVKFDDSIIAIEFGEKYYASSLYFKAISPAEWEMKTISEEEYADILAYYGEIVIEKGETNEY